MLKTFEELREMTSDLTVSIWTASAIATLLESGVASHLREPIASDELARRCRSLSRGQIEKCLGVATAAGVVVTEGERYRLSDGAMPLGQPQPATAVAGDLRSSLMQALSLLDGARRDGPTTGWHHTNAAMLQAQGDASSALPGFLKMRFLPMLDDLGSRLEQPGARLLDVGVGVGALSIAMCRAFPEITVVGLDTADAPLAIARQNVVATGLVQRIELRKQAVDALADEEAFDLVWFPSFFVDAPPSTLGRLHASLRSGGWLLFGTTSGGGSERRRAVESLVNEQWGGSVTAPADIETMLRDAGFASVRRLPGPDWAPAMIVGKRP